MVFFDRWNKWIAVSWALPLFVFFVVRSLGACAVIAVTIGHACLTGWLLASLATRSPLSLLSRCPRYLGALACTECTLLHATLPTRPLPMYHLSTCATVRNCLSPPPPPIPSSSSSYNLSSAIRFLPVNLSCAPRQVILLSFLWVPARFAILLFSILFADILDSSSWLLPLCLSFLSYYNFIYDVYFPCMRLSDSLSSDIGIFLHSEILFNIKKK